MSVPDWWNRLRYRAYAPVYDVIAAPLADGRRRAIAGLHLDDGDEVLLLGCGPGSDLPHLPTGVDVTAVDLAPAMVRRAERRATTLGLEIDARVADARSLPFEDGRFDAVCLHLILSVVPDPRAVVAETARVLASDGCVSVYDKFVPPGADPGLARRLLNPIATVLFSDLTRQLDPLLATTDLAVTERSTVLGGVYTVAHARRRARPAD